jgi:hypothetical protein
MNKIKKIMLAGALTLTGLAAALGISRLGREEVRPQPTLEERANAEDNGVITVHTALRDGSQYTKEAFALAEDYFRENLGANVKFKYCKREEIPKNLDHLRNFAAIEENGETLGKKKVGEAKESITDEEIAKAIEHYATKGKGNAPKAVDLDALNKEVSEGYERIVENIAAEANLKESTIYLVEDKSKGSLNKTLGRDYMNKIAAKDLVHEMLHEGGLYHTHDFVNDDLEDFLEDGTPNVMSYQLPGKGKYGFGMTQAQKDEFRSYFAKGARYNELSSAGFDYLEFVKKYAEKKGYKMASEYKGNTRDGKK